jgi:hypothetical protein
MTDTPNAFALPTAYEPPTVVGLGPVRLKTAENCSPGSGSGTVEPPEDNIPCH